MGSVAAGVLSVESDVTLLGELLLTQPGHPSVEGDRRGMFKGTPVTMLTHHINIRMSRRR